MATGGLLLHHLHPHPHPHPRPPPLHLAESHRTSALNRLRFLPKLFTTIPPKRGFLQPTQRSVQCVKQEEQAGSDGEAVEWVNKAAHDPMVEFDPVTVFRRIVAERRASASSAMARAKEEEANLALQTTSPSPFILGSKWRSKSATAIIIALVLLAVAAALYFLRSKDREDATELTSADTKDTLKASVNGRRKLVEGTVKAPNSVLTAMALGAASVSRPKVHIGSTHGTLHASNGNIVEGQRPEGGTDFNSVVSTVAVEDMKSDLHGKPMFGQTSSSTSIVEDFTSSKVENVGIEVTEGPWFGQDVNGTQTVASAELQELESKMSPLAESQEPDGCIESQALPVTDETIALPAAEQFATEVSVGEVGFETSVLTNIVDGKFHGEVVAVSEQPNHSNVQVLEFKFEEPQNDGVLAENSTTVAEKLEQTIEEDSITPLKGNSVAEGTVCLEPNIVIESSLLDLSNGYGQFDETDSGNDYDDNDNTKHHAVEQYFTLNQDDGVMSLEANDSKNGFEEVQVSEGYSLSPNLDSVITEGRKNVDHTLEGIETEADDVLDGVSSSVNMSQMDQVEENEGFACGPRKEPLTDNRAAVQATEEDFRADSKKALEAAVPAIAIGVGTVGAIFGVAGGLQVVGFAALASFLSRDFLWAQSREELWQELNGITDRQKLLDFLAKRNLMRSEPEN